MTIFNFEDVSDSILSYRANLNCRATPSMLKSRGGFVFCEVTHGQA